MSHNVTVSGVRINNLKLLKTAIKNLGIAGVELVEDGKNFRTYIGQSTHCDAMIRMPGAHDIGLRKNKDGDYQMVFDPQGFSRVLCPEGDQQTNDPAVMVGKLTQEYGIVTSEFLAAEQGYETTRIKGKAGMVQLEINVPA